MANWLLLTGKDGASIVVGPLHHVGVEGERIVSYDEFEREVEIARRAKAAISGKWGDGGVAYGRWSTVSGFEFDVFDLCDGRGNPWPDFRAVSLSKAKA
jgi:hypothetical protein